MENGLTVACDVTHPIEFLDRETAAETITAAVENLRQAMLHQSQRLAELRAEWNEISREEFHGVLFDNLCQASHQYITAPAVRLFTACRHLISVTYNKAHPGIGLNPQQDDFQSVVLGGDDTGLCFLIPREPQIIDSAAWPYWLEKARDAFPIAVPSFPEIREVGGIIERAARVMRVDVAELRNQLQAGSSGHPEGIIALKIRGCDLLEKAAGVMERTTRDIARNLQVIELATSDLIGSSVELDALLLRLHQSPGFRELGTQLIELFANNCRKGTFVIERRTLAERWPESMLALDSALSAMTAEELLVGTGLGSSEELWVMPLVCLLEVDADGSEVEPLSELNGIGLSTGLRLPNAMEPKSAVAPTPVAQDAGNGLNKPSIPLDHAGLLQVAVSRMTDDQQKVVRYVVERNGSVHLDSLALQMEWSHPFTDAWNGIKRRINDEIAAHNAAPLNERDCVANVSLGLTRRKNHAVLMPLDSFPRRKKQASKAPRNKKRATRK